MQTSSSEDDTHVGGITGGDGGDEGPSLPVEGDIEDGDVQLEDTSGEDETSSESEVNVEDDYSDSESSVEDVEVLFSIDTLSCVEVCVLVVYISCNVDQGMSWYIWLSVGICCVVSEEISLSFNFRAPLNWLWSLVMYQKLNS